MSELQGVDIDGIDQSQLDDAATILDELEDKYEDDAGAIINILMVCLAGMMDATEARRLTWSADDGTELVATYSPGREPEETLH